MFFYKKILIVIIAFLGSYLLWRLRNSRKQIISEYSISESFTSDVKLNNTYPQTLKLQDYCIKSSLNSAYNGAIYKIDCDPKNPNNILKTVLQRGVRFLDFEIYSVGNEPIVGYSSSYENINFNKVCKSIISFKPVQITDPLFIQLRIKTQKTELYSKIANYISQNFQGALYSGKINENTLLSDLNNKIIIVIDIQKTNSSYSSASVDFKSLVNLETGTSLNVITTTDLLKSKSKRININTDGVTITTNESSPIWTLSYPDIMATSNPDIKSLMNQQCPNIIQCRFDLDDSNLALYEKIFTNQAFVPLGSAFQIASKWQ